MIRRKSTLDKAEQAKRTKFVQIYSILDLCLQLTSDDRLIIRNLIKNGDQKLAQRIHQCKKDKNYQTLQIHLRKVIKDYKENDKFAKPIMKSNTRGKTPCESKSSKVPTESSFYNSVSSSVASSAEKSKQTAILQLRRNENQKHKELPSEFLKQKIQNSSQRVSYREIELEVKPQPLKISKKLFQNQIPTEESNIKSLLKSKIMEKSRQVLPQLPTTVSCELGAQNLKTSFQQSFVHKQEKPLRIQVQSYKQNRQNKQNKPIPKNPSQYGQFYKRIKKVIQQAI